MNLLYSIAGISDLGEILIMRDEVKERIILSNLNIWRDGYPLDEYIIDDIQHYFGRVVKDNNKIIAYASVHAVSTEYPKDTFSSNHYNSFGRIMVCNEYLGKHIGSYFIKNIIAEAKDKGYPGIGILVDAFNERAINLYSKFDFVKKREVDFPYGHFDVLELKFDSLDIINSNMHRIHTTVLGLERISKVLPFKSELELVNYISSMINHEDTIIHENNKNYYMQNKVISFTINKTSYTVITATKPN